MFEKSELTAADWELTNEQAREKNRVDENSMLHVTPLMTSMFSDGSDVQYIKNFTQKKKSLFTPVRAEDAPSRIITSAEYNAFPEKDRNLKTVMPRALLGSIPFILVFVLISVFWIPGIINGIKEGFNSAFLLFTLFWLVALLLMIIMFSGNIKKYRKRIIGKDDRIISGKAALFYKEHSMFGTGESRFYIDIAFYDDRKIIKRINCSEDVFNLLSFDSDVVIYNDNIYAYNKNGKLITG